MCIELQLRNFSDSLSINSINNIVLQNISTCKIKLKEISPFSKKTSKVAVQNIHRLLVILLAVYDFLVRFILHKCYECLFWSYNIWWNFDYFRDTVSRWAGKVLAHPEFGSSVNPIPTKGADYAYDITASLPGLKT